MARDPDIIQLLADSGMAKEDVHACVIVGGSSLIPIIQEQLISTLGLKELTRNLDVYEAAALGAGFYAAGQPRAHAWFRPRQIVLTCTATPTCTNSAAVVF